MMTNDPRYPFRILLLVIGLDTPYRLKPNELIDHNLSPHESLIATYDKIHKSVRSAKNRDIYG
jgi:hypothetical protein